MIHFTRQKKVKYTNTDSKDDKSEVSLNSTGILRNKFYVYALIGVCVIFLVLKLMFLNPKVVWDESVYLGMGKYAYSQGQSGLWEMIRPLGLPLVTGFFWKLGQDNAMNQIVMSRIFSILISLGCIIVTYLIAKKLFDKKHSMISALILVCTPIFFFYSSYILTDHISTLFLMLSILFLFKDRYVFAGFFGGAAFWFKFTNILYIIALLLFIIYKLIDKWIKNRKSHDKKSIFLFISKSISDKNIKKYLYTIAITLLCIAAYFLSNYALYHEHYSVMDAIFRPYIDASSYSNNPYQNTVFSSAPLLYIFYYPFNIIFSHTYGLLIYIFVIIYFWRYRKFIKKESKESHESHTLLLFIFFTYLLYLSTIPYKVDRFWITFLPFMAMYASFGILWLFDNIDNKKFGKWHGYGKYIRIILIIVIIILFGIAIYKDAQVYKQNKSDTLYYNLYPANQNLRNVEKYFDNHNITGPILVTSPVFAAYSDKKFIGAYDVLNKNSLFVNDWESNTSFNAVAYMDSSIPCMKNDANCLDNKRKLQDMIKEKFIEKDSYIYDGSNITFFVKRISAQRVID